MTRYAAEFVLPFYALFAVFIYFRPETLAERFDGGMMETAFGWLLWGLAAALTGVLAISALFLAFYLLYSPLYLAGQLRHLFSTRKWTDRREVRFYLGCFVMLCVLLGLAAASPTAAAVAFVILAGSAQLLWRFLV
jgi:hypothetical protein